MRTRLFLWMSRLIVVFLLVMLLAVIALPSSIVHADVIQVTTLIDENTANSDCSLREAITAANTDTAYNGCLAGSGADTITFAVSGTINLTNTLPSLTSAITIDGPGADALAIDGQGEFRIFSIDGDATVTMNDLTIIHGNDLRGGAINTRGTLTMSNSAFSRNQSTYGGGINNSGTLTVISSTFSENQAIYGSIFNTGTLTVIDSTFSGNVISRGGGIHNPSDGEATVTHSTFSQNQVRSGGGGISNNGMLTVSDSIFSQNQCGHGGGISNNGMLTVSDSIFSQNQCGHGGGINNGGTLTVTNSTFSANVSVHGGGVHNSSSGEAIITSSVVWGNQAQIGGGISNSGTMAITNSTISGNTASQWAGGISNGYGTLSVTSSTIAANTGELGSGIRDSSGSAIFRNTIMASNDCYQPVVDGGNNLDSGNTCGFSHTNNSLVNSDPLLGPLADNRGWTLTHALLEGSPAINAGSNEFAAALTTDQRGQPRIVGDVVDMGAYESDVIHPDAVE